MGKPPEPTHWSMNPPVQKTFHTIPFKNPWRNIQSTQVLLAVLDAFLLPRLFRLAPWPNLGASYFLWRRGAWCATVTSQYRTKSGKCVSNFDWIWLGVRILFDRRQLKLDRTCSIYITLPYFTTISAPQLGWRRLGQKAMESGVSDVPNSYIVSGGF